MKKLLTLLWIVTVTVIAVQANQLEGLERSRAILGYISWIVLITFPSSFLLAGIGFIIVYLFGNDALSFKSAELRYIENYLFYAVFGVVGYLQWFVAVPKLYYKFKSWRNRRAKEPES